MISFEQLQSNGLVIMNSVLYLTQISKKSLESQRNLLNKWFQDSIKNYILEQIAAPLIAEQLSCKFYADVQNLIRKRIDHTKPKYMSIIDQYFMHIKNFKQDELFVESLAKIVTYPIERKGLKEKNTYKTEKMVRKQFVCYLLLRFFKIYGQEDIPSFYELWNYCFPSEIQTKKRLSRYDKKKSTQKGRMTKAVNSEINEQSQQPEAHTANCSSSSTLSLHTLPEQKSECEQECSGNLNSQQISVPLCINSSLFSLENHEKKQEEEDSSQEIVPQETIPQLKISQINNRIFGEVVDNEENECNGFPKQQLSNEQQPLQQLPVFEQNQFEYQQYVLNGNEEFFALPYEEEIYNENEEYQYYEYFPAQQSPSEYYMNNQTISFDNQFQHVEYQNYQLKHTTDSNYQQYTQYDYRYKFC